MFMFISPFEGWTPNGTLEGEKTSFGTPGIKKKLLTTQDLKQLIDLWVKLINLMAMCTSYDKLKKPEH